MKNNDFLDKYIDKTNFNFSKTSFCVNYSKHPHNHLYHVNFQKNNPTI